MRRRYPAPVALARYPYLGPSDLRGERGGDDICVATTAAALCEWLDRRDPRDRVEPFTFVIDLEGCLRLAPRRSEHVALAGGRSVHSAGEMAFGDHVTGWFVVGVSNHSTGHRPDPESWPAVAAALDRIGIEHPGDFTTKIVFRVCPGCGQLNIIHDDNYVCAICDGDLAP
jgi:hypothetical protein